MVGEPVLGFGGVTGTIAGALLVAADALLSTPVIVSGTHLISVIVCAHRSPEPHLPWQGSDSHNPDLGLQNVSPVQIAMHPPAARDAAAAPMARLLIAAAPTSVFGLPVLHAASSNSSVKVTLAMVLQEPVRCDPCARPL
jgi:hypothetical protein